MGSLVKWGDGNGPEARGQRRRGHSPLVNPADGHPLRFTVQLLQGVLQLLECPFHVVVDQAEVKVMPVAPLDTAALIDRPLQVRVLRGTREKRASCKSLKPPQEGRTPRRRSHKHRGATGPIHLHERGLQVPT